MDGSTRFYARYYGGLLRRSGFSLAKGLALPLVRAEAVRSGAHAMAYPISTYAPWQSDSEFRRVYGKVRANTLVDIWRCHELWSLLAEVCEIPGAVVEVGVWRGGSGALMAARMAGLGLGDPVYLCDTWEGVVKTGPDDIYYHDGEHADTSKAIVQALVARMGLANVQLLQGVFPEETAAQVTADALRLVHVDVDVYQSAKDVIEWAWPRLSSGGVAVFDDYGFPACPGVTRFVEEQRRMPDRLVLHNLNGHGIVIKR
ncbi:MAG: class I SAM-dependent methyltransferase [Solirubrobacterales bacterium]|nr:class I SAM-dependent methyltransferase [Solirubrobacterales bacterium]